MSLNNDRTTLVCLFHDQDRAQATLSDLAQASISESAITVVGGPEASSDAFEKSALAAMEMPDKDYDHLRDGLHRGGVVVAVAASAEQADDIERIFKKNSANQIDEVERDTTAELAPVAAAVVPSGSMDREEVIPIAQEELVVGKRQVDMGGVRVVRHIVEVPVTQSVDLHEERVVVERRPVDRAVTADDLAYGGQTIEVVATGEEAVVGKNARVVEEVLIGKVGSDRTETIQDSVRHTEVDVEPVVESTKNSDTLRR